MTTTDQAIYLCPRWCADKDHDGDGDPHVHFGYVGLAGDAAGSPRFDVVLVQDLQEVNDTGPAAPPRVQVWTSINGAHVEVPLPPTHARSLARWLNRAADMAEGPPFF